MAFLKNIYHFLLVFLGSIIYGRPSRKLIVIGITGTKGKTSSVELLHAVLQAAGKKAALLSSIYVAYGNERVLNPSDNTMPGRFFIQKFLAQAVQKACTYAVFEVTSQGVVQHRHRFIDFDIAALTNLHPEHIESHGSFEKYRDAKVDFFRYVASHSKQASTFFINANCKNKQFFEKAAGEHKKIMYSRTDLRGTFSPWIMSEFNLENAALVYAIAREIGVATETVERVYQTFSGVAGRYEWLTAKTANGNFSVVIDYAHTPDSFEALLGNLRSRLRPTLYVLHPRLIAVFGSYGEGRDKWKRPEIGAIADRYSDKMYLTNEGPGNENPQEIVDQIASGIKQKAKINIILDRREAIQAALTNAREGDIVALIGKGHETYINLGTHKIEWNERRIAEEVLHTL